jgi:hypothetical protein
VCEHYRHDALGRIVSEIGPSTLADWKLHDCRRASLQIRKLPKADRVTSFSGIDDFLQAPNGNVLVTYMGAKNLTTPGGLVEIDLDGRSLENARPPSQADRSGIWIASTVKPIPGCWPIHTGLMPART